MAKNRALQEAARAQQDEFYTDIRDIEHELMYYSKELFYDKVVLCNCDYPYESAFFEHFATGSNLSFSETSTQSHTKKSSHYS